MKRGELSDLALILQAIDFVEAHLQEAISVADVAESVSFSLFHFSRTFSRVTRHTPYDYLMRRRLTEAACCLLESDDKIIEIAFDFQFKAPETFSRAFKRVFNMQPRQARQQGGVDRRLLMSKPIVAYLEFLNRGASLKPRAVKLPAMEIAGLATQISSRDAISEVTALWNLLGQEMAPSALAAGKRSYLGVMLVPKVPARQVMYLAGTVLEDGEEAPRSFVQKTIPALDGASFEIPRHPEAAQFARQYTYNTWWPKATDAPLPGMEIERFSAQLENQPAADKDPLPRSLFFPLPIK